MSKQLGFSLDYSINEYDPNEEFDFATMPTIVDNGETQFKLEDDQYEATKAIIQWLHENPMYRAPFMRLAGYAGSGKTLVISYLLQAHGEVFPKYMRLKDICVATFTWKAATVLQKRGVRNACSIHSIFYEVETDRDLGTMFRRRDPNEIREMYSLIIIDEASMVAKDMREDLEASGVPILYVGDSGQLPPIADGDDVPFMSEPELRLTKIRRQALESPIIRLSIDIRNGKRIPYGKYGDGVFKVTPSEINDNILLKTDQMICGKNATRQAINRKVRRLKGYDRTKMPYAGEKVIGLNNIPDSGLFNGLQWITSEDHSDVPLTRGSDILISFESEPDRDGKVVRHAKRCCFPDDQLHKEYDSKAKLAFYLKDNDIHAMDFGYAITTHKSQGSSFRKPVIFEEWLGDKEFHKKWLYTAVTRAVDKVFIVTPEYTR